MSYTNVTRGQASFVSRTAKRDVQHPGGTTTFVKRVTGEQYLNQQVQTQKQHFTLDQGTDMYLNQH